MTELQIVIIEDEQKAAADLASQLKVIDPKVNIIVTLDSVAGTVKWLQHNQMPDLFFMDIHLGDGSCFEIFDKVQITCPVIFCTAYDEYALEAFKSNSIGYIVKPVDRVQLAEALEKYRVLQKHYIPSTASLENITKLVQPTRYKTSYLLPFKSKMVPVPVDTIACMYLKNDQTYILTQKNELLINKTLEQLQSELDPGLFYRVNRQYIVSFRFIKEIEHLSGRKIEIILSVPYEDPIVVSKDAASGFKAWMEQR